MSYRIYVGKLENFQSMVDSTKKPNIVRQYVPRVEVGRGRKTDEDCLRMEIDRQEVI